MIMTLHYELGCPLSSLSKKKKEKKRKKRKKGGKGSGQGEWFDGGERAAHVPAADSPSAARQRA